MHPWVIGWIAADGHNRGDMWTISQNIDDADPLYVIRGLIPGTSLRIEKDKKNRYGTKPMVVIWNNDAEACRELVCWGIPIGDKTVTTALPTHCGDMDMWPYIRGVLEGDGSIGIDEDGHPRIEITISKPWCDACKIWLEQRGINSYVVDEKEIKGVSNLIIHNVEGARAFLEHLYLRDRDLRMSRKFALATKVLLTVEYGDVLARKSMTRAKRADMIEKAKELARVGKSAAKISKELGCSSVLAIKAVRQVLGTVKERWGAKIIAAEKLLQTGVNRTEAMKKLGIGPALVNRAFVKVFGKVDDYKREMQQRKTTEIRRMILAGEAIFNIHLKVRCAINRVIAEKRKLAAEGFNIKFNKRRKFRE